MRAGFTLVELLVVIGVMGVLSALLLPALSKAKDRSRQAACLSNLGQIGLAFGLHLGDHEDRFAMLRQEELRLMEILWAELSREESELNSPACHCSTLREPADRLARGAEQALNWTDAKAQLRKP